MNPDAQQARIAPLTVEQVHAMLDAGILAEGEPIELIEGVLVYKDRSAAGRDPMTIGEKHNLIVTLLAQLAVQLTGRGCFIQTQGPVSFPPHSEPEPDGAVIRGSARDYTERLPQASDAETIVEVSDASLQYDRTTKLALYAAAGIPQYAIVNLQDEVIEVHEGPDAPARRYRTTLVLRRGDSLSLRVPDGRIEIRVDALLP